MIRLGLLLIVTALSFPVFSNEERDITSYLNLKKGDKNSELVKTSEDEDIRLTTMKDTAVYLGIQVGFNDELRTIYSSIKEIDPDLNRIFDFGVIMRSTNSGSFEMFMLPGIVEEYKGTIEVGSDGRSITTTEKRIEIVSPEKLISEAPNWRNYLYSTEFVDVQKPFEQVLPEPDSAYEQNIWKAHFLKGYEIGVNQANAEIIAKAQMLRKNFTGRVKYIRYMLDGKIEAPKLSLFKEDLIALDNEMRINERTYTINQGARFNPDTGKWEILFLDNRDGLRKGNE